MPVPKRKRSRARRDSRFANKFVKVKTITACPNCTQALMPHTLCKNCGHYKGVKVMTPKSERAVARLESRSAQAARMQKAQAASEAADKSE